jgi:hypothetical protein
VVDGFRATPFALAAKGVSQILSEVGSVDGLFLSVGTIRDWFLHSVGNCGVNYVNDLNLTMRLEWHTHASRLGVDLDPPGLNHLLLPSVCKQSNLNSNDHFGLPTPSRGGERLINYNNYKSYENLRKSTKNLWADKLSVKLSVEIILDTSFYFIFFDSIISMVLYPVAISSHTLHFSHYFLLQQRKRIYSF